MAHWPNMRHLKLFSAIMLMGLVSVQSAFAYALIDLTPKTATSMPGIVEAAEEELVETVELRYPQKGRFLALVPVSFDVTVRVHDDGSLELIYPWYSILTVDNDEEVRAELEVAVDNALRSLSVGSVRAQGERSGFTEQEAAEVTQTIEKVLQSRLEANSG